MPDPRNDKLKKERKKRFLEINALELIHVIQCPLSEGDCTLIRNILLSHSARPRQSDVENGQTKENYEAKWYRNAVDGHRYVWPGNTLNGETGICWGMRLVRVIIANAGASRGITEYMLGAWIGRGARPMQQDRVLWRHLERAGKGCLLMYCLKIGWLRP